MHFLNWNREKNFRSILLGKGYLLSLKDKKQIKKDLKSCNIEKEKINVFAGASTKIDRIAENYILDDYHLSVTISPEQEKCLFDLQWNDAKTRMNQRLESIELKVEDINPSLYTYLMDLEFTEQLTPNVWRRMEHMVKDSNFGGIMQFGSEPHFWVNVLNVERERFDNYQSLLDTMISGVKNHNRGAQIHGEHDL